MAFSSEQYGNPDNITMHRMWLHTNAKIAGMYFLVSGLIAFTFVALFSLGANLNLGGMTGKLVYISGFLLAGIAHIYTFPKFLKLAEKAGKEIFVYTFLLAAFIFICSLLFFLFTGPGRPAFALAGACSFFLPSAMILSWYSFNNIFPAEGYTTWTLPATAPDQKVSIFLNSIQISMQLKMNWFDEAETNFVITIPPRITLGEMFHRFLMDKEAQSVHIQLFDREQQPFRWKFTLKKQMVRRMLDPALTLIQNDINQDDIIIPERILEASEPFNN